MNLTNIKLNHETNVDIRNKKQTPDGKISDLILLITAKITVSFDWKGLLFLPLV